jgi:hypothetical protein
MMGLLRAAGSISGILGVAPGSACTARLAIMSRAHQIVMWEESGDKILMARQIRR